MSPSRALYIDDRDPAITYSSLTQNTSVWRPYRGEPTEFMQTTTGANQVGATVKIIFTGSDISVFGTVSEASFVGGAAPLTNYILDSNLPFPFQPIPGNDRQYNVAFYRSPQNLSAGPHILQIALQSPGSYWLDYMVINGDVSVSAGDDLATNSPTLGSPSVVHPSSPSGSSAVIASGILGGLLGLLLFFGLVFFILRRRRRPRKLSHNPQGTLIPFISLFNHSTASVRDSTTAQMSEYTGPPRTFMSSRTNKRGETMLEPPPPMYFSSEA